MYAFRYKHGDRPLDGYTIQRAAGRGGFGEVYYAVSDSGREVALKAITGYEQIELRGISQCMNLKSPHLVTIFDVRHNDEGRPFVIMEYVSGPSLRQLLDESPGGIGEQKAAFFLREIAKGLAFLHDCGIVHRDLKPGNIFYENGYVKIGDYGLSKAMAASQHSGQTVTVGTVHYMAPEIGAGRYDRSIDIYALGAVLYEMLTGTPPYVGASPSEVLLKHLSAEPDCTSISEPFAAVIRKSMAKDPASRYQSVQEMVEGVFGAEHVRQSVSVFSPEELSVVAERVAKAVAAGGGPAEAAGNGSDRSDQWGRAGERIGRTMERLAERWERKTERMQRRWHRAGAGKEGCGGRDSSRDMTVPIEDPLPRRYRVMLALVTTVVISAAAAVLSPPRLDPLAGGGFVLLSIAGMIGGLKVLHRIDPRVRNESRGLRRIIAAGVMTIGAAVVSSLAWLNMPYQPGIWPALLVPLLIVDALKWTNPDRHQRVILGQAIGVGVLGWVFARLFGASPHLAMATLAGAALVAQARWPWQPRTRAAASQPAVPPPSRSHSSTLNSGTGAPPVPPISVPLPLPQAAPLSRPQPRYWSRPVPAVFRYLWLGLFVLTLSLGAMFCVGAGSTTDPRAVAPFAAGGIAFLIPSLMCLIRAGTYTYYGIWNYLLRPLILCACAGTATAAGIVLGNHPGIRGEQVMPFAFFIVFFGVAFLVVAFIPGRWQNRQPAVRKNLEATGISPCKRTWALLFCALIFAGAAGVQRLYVGRIRSGILYLITGGLLGIGQLIDAIRIANGTFTDARGRRLLVWDDEDAEAEPWPVRPARAPSTKEQPSMGEAPMPQPAAATPEEGTPMVSLPSTTSLYQPGASHAAGLLAALAGLLILAGAVLGIALSLDPPGAVASGLFNGPGPQQDVARDVQMNLFNGYADWPRLVHKLGDVTLALLMLVAAVVLIFARRWGGVGHMFRGVIGTAGITLATVLLGSCFKSALAWTEVAPLVQQKQFAPAMDAFLGHWALRGVITTAAILLVSVILLAWPGARPPAVGERGDA